LSSATLTPEAQLSFLAIPSGLETLGLQVSNTIIKTLSSLHRGDSHLYYSNEQVLCDYLIPHSLHREGSTYVSMRLF